MYNKITTVTIFLVLLFFSKAHEQKVLLSSVKGLTFYRGRYTTGRRLAPSMQMKRVGGDAKTNFEPDSVYCENRGTDGISIQWKCEAQLNSNYRLGRVEVVCEGFEKSGDPYILTGSCALEYELEYTSKGKNREKRRHERRNEYSNTQYYYQSDSNGFEVLFFLFIVVIFLLIGFRLCSRQNIVYSTYGQPNYVNQNFGYPSTTTYVNNNNGFWSGMGLGYLWGSSNQPYYSSGYRRSYQPSYSSSYDSSSYNSSSSYDDDSSTHISTGYGGTRTR
eukprot:gene2893-4736_t